MKRMIVAGLLWLAACSSAKSPAAGDMDQSPGRDLAMLQMDLGMPGGDLANAYPPGPYGNMIGSTIAPLEWEGYVNPSAQGIATTKTYGAYTMNDLRMSGARYGLLYAADYS